MDRETPTPRLVAKGTLSGANLEFAKHTYVMAISLGLFTFAVCYFRLFIFPDVPLVPGGDQLDFVVDGSRMVAGQLPYRDYFQIVPAGADLTYALLIRWFGLHDWMPGIVMACLAVGAVVLITVVARRLMRGPVVALPGFLFTGITLLASLDATHHWFSTLAAMAAMLVLFSGISVRRIAAAGALCGLAACFTQTAGATVLAGFLAYLVWKMRCEGAPAREWWRKCLLLAGAAATVFAAVNAYFIWAAGLRQWIFCLIVYPLLYYSVPAVNNWRILLYGFGWSPGAAKWIVFPSMYFVPVIYVIFVLTMHGRRKRDRSEPWDQLLLLAITGFGLFLSVASQPSQMRLSTVSPPATILLAWLIDRPGKTWSRLKTILGVAAVALAIAAPIHHQTRWRAYLDLPAGRTAFSDPVQYDEYRWVLRHTHPGQFFYGMPPMYFPFHLMNPTAVQGIDSSDYTRPEQVEAALRALEQHPVPLMIIRGRIEDPAPEPGDHSGPFRDYLLANYRVTKAFANGDRVWERIQPGAASSSCLPRNPNK